MLTLAQREARTSAEEAAVIALALGGRDFIEIMVGAVMDSSMADDEIEELGNRIGRIPHERLRK